MNLGARIGSAVFGSICWMALFQLARAEAPNMGPLVVHVVKAISGQQVLPDEPILGVPGTEVQLTACRGEYEPGSIVLHAARRVVNDITLVPGALTGSRTGTVIAASSIDIKVVKPWYQSYYSWNEIGKAAPEDFRQRLTPELLLNDDGLVTTDADGQRNLVRIDGDGRSQYVWVNPETLASRSSRSSQDSVTLDSWDFSVRDAPGLRPFSIAAQENKQIWLTVHVPMTAAADRYEGRVTVKERGRTVGTLTIVLRVPDIDLTPSQIAYAIYYRGVLDNARAGVGSEFKTMRQMAAELRGLKRHGIDFPTVYQPVADIAAIRRVLQLRKTLGLGNKYLFFLGVTTSEPIAALMESVPKVQAVAGLYGYSNVFIYGVDEARGAKLVAQREKWSALHGLGVNVFVAGYSGAFDSVGDLLDIQVHAHQPSAVESGLWHSTGQKIYSYGNPQTAAENPVIFRLNYGLLLWANRYDGAMPYAYQHCFGSCWNDVDHPSYRDHVLAYPTADGAIDTLAFEGLREAVDDVRYITTLERRLEGMAGYADPDAERARAFLKSLRAEVMSKQRSSGKYNTQMDVDLDSIRRRIVDLIESLR